MNLNHLFTSYTKLISKLIINVNIKAKIMKYLNKMSRDKHRFLYKT